MHVDSLRAAHFRNYEFLEVEFQPGVNLFLGGNAQGKTNLLEALYYLSIARSFRSATDEEVIQRDADAAAVECAFHRGENQTQARLEFKRNRGKALFLNGKKQEKLSTLLGRLQAVVFSPDDLFLVKGAPSLRRRYLDLTILQADATYLASLQHYGRALKQRNSLLEQRGPSLDAQLSVWDQSLSQSGATLTKKRAEVSKKLSAFAGKALQDLTGGEEVLEVQYEPSLKMGESEGEIQGNFLEALRNTRRAELARGSTLVGPHRDDLSLRLNGAALRKFGSQGQQRTGALALKLAQLSLLTEECGETPLILFDDVMAELDEKRQAFFLNRLQAGGQAFLTGTSAHDFAATRGQARVFTVKDGKVEREKGSVSS